MTDFTAIYIRVSTDEQAASGVSIAMQQDLCEKYVELHDLPRDIIVIKDEGKSGGTLDRPGLDSLRHDMRGRDIKHVVVFKLDRLTRNVHDLGTLLREFDKAGVALHGVRDRLDTDTPSGRLLVNIMASVAEWERDTIRDRVKSGMAEVKRQGYHVGAPPYGWEGVTVDGYPGQLLRPTHEYPDISKARGDRRTGQSLAAIGHAYRGQHHPQAGKRVIEAPLIDEMQEVEPGLYRRPATL